MLFNMHKLYELCLFSHSNLVIQFRLLLFVVFILVFTTSSYDFIGHFIGISLESIGFRSNDSHLNSENINPTLQDRIDISEILPNCGIRSQCGDDDFPVHIYTGQDKDDQPKLCVGGKYIYGVGRGLNIAVIEPVHSMLKSLKNFDLYSQNSSALEVWLEHDLNNNDIIIAFTFDEASKELSKNAKAILYLLGSGKIQDLQYRCQWYMISQKGITGFTPLEEITYGKNFRWGKAIDKRLCVPKKIEPMMVSPDPYPRKNPLREQLCDACTELKYDRFCDSLNKHEPYIPSQLTNRSLIGNPVFSTPVIVIAGPSMSTLSLTLETLIYQPGIQSSSVYLIHTIKQIYAPIMAKIFGFKSLAINSSFPLTTSDKIEFGLNYISLNFPSKEYAIVIEEGLILASDFLFYMAQLVPVLAKDDSIMGISAWNPYGYVGTSGNPFISYRVENFPGLGFLIRISIFNDHMKGKMSQCCSQKSFLGWKFANNGNITGNIIIPDVSRVLKRPRDYFYRKRKDSEFYVFTNVRVTNIDQIAWVHNPFDLVQENYDQLLVSLINTSITIRFSHDDLLACKNSSNIAVTKIMKQLQNKTLSIFYKERESGVNEVLKAHLLCFNEAISKHNEVQNMYKNTLRFTLNSNNVLLVENKSIFARKTDVN